MMLDERQKTKDESRDADTLSSFVLGRSSIQLVDTHCHLDWRAFDDDREAVIGRAVDAGVTRMVTVGIDVDSSRRAVALADRYEAVYATVGVHPNDAAGLAAPALNAIRELAAHPKVVAIGEIGLDHYWKKVAPEEQLRAFEAQLELAADMGKPVIVHNRDATSEVMTILERHVARHSSLESPGVLHSFFDGLDVARRAFDLGFLVGFSGPLTFKKSAALRDLARRVPADRFVVETDAPFLAPEPRRGRRNEPANARFIADVIARERQVSLSELTGRLSASVARLFGWKSDYGTPTH